MLHEIAIACSKFVKGLWGWHLTNLFFSYSNPLVHEYILFSSKIFSSNAINPFNNLKIDPGGYNPESALLNKGFSLFEISFLKFFDLFLPESWAGLYDGEDINDRISPLFGSIATIAPILFCRA